MKPQFNLKNNNSIETNYSLGLLPQRNKQDLWYQETSCRSNLNQFVLNSENRRTLRKTDYFSYEIFDKDSLKYTSKLQKIINLWLKELKWDFPISSVKTIFNNHVFNRFYFWYDRQSNLSAVSVCYHSSEISHIAYVFYDPKYARQDLPIRLVLQVIIDSHQQNLKYCYLGRFSYYKRNMPGFENFDKNTWSAYNKTGFQP